MTIIMGESTTSIMWEKKKNKDEKEQKGKNGKKKVKEGKEDFPRKSFFPIVQASLILFLFSSKTHKGGGGESHMWWWCRMVEQLIK